MEGGAPRRLRNFLPAEAGGDRPPLSHVTCARRFRKEFGPSRRLRHG